MGAGIPDSLACGLAFVTAKNIEDDDIAGRECGDQELLDIGAEAFAIDRAVEDAGRADAVGAQGCDESELTLASMGSLADQALPARPPPS
jgi:hypothetical protein